MMNLLLALFLQAGVVQSAFPVQVGYALDRDTATVGDHVTLIVRVLAPAGARFEFPAGPDTAHREGGFPVELIGHRATTMRGDTAVAGYRLAAWDVGAQAVNMPDIFVTYRGQREAVPLPGISLFVRSVLPSDTSLRRSKPARPPISLVAFDWRRWLWLLLALLLAVLMWWLWRGYRNRAAAPLHPYARALAEFARIEKQLPPEREPDRHFAAMVDVMRDYLAARVASVRRSYTTRELLGAMPRFDEVELGLPALLERADLVKFARARATPSEAAAAGQSARTIVDRLESRIARAEADEKNEKKLERAA